MPTNYLIHAPPDFQTFRHPWIYIIQFCQVFTLKHLYFRLVSTYSFTIRDMYWHLSRWKKFQGKSKIASVIDPSIKRTNFVGHTWKSELGAFINYIPIFKGNFYFSNRFFLFCMSLMSGSSHIRSVLIGIELLLFIYFLLFRWGKFNQNWFTYF